MGAVFTNQGRSLSWRLPSAGIAHEDLQGTSPEDPLLVYGEDVDITHDHRGTYIHFCRSGWEAFGIPRISRPTLKVPRVRFRCDLPSAERRYTLDAELYLPPGSKRPILVVIGFRNPIETPPSLKFVFNDVRPAQFITTPKQMTSVIDNVPDALVLI